MVAFGSVVPIPTCAFDMHIINSIIIVIKFFIIITFRFGKRVTASISYRDKTLGKPII